MPHGKGLLLHVCPQGLDALILPGGWSPDYLRRDKRMVALVRDTFKAGMIRVISHLRLLCRIIFTHKKCWGKLVLSCMCGYSV